MIITKIPLSVDQEPFQVGLTYARVGQISAQLIKIFPSGALLMAPTNRPGLFTVPASQAHHWGETPF